MATPDVRLVSYNVRALRDSSAAVARVVRACNPDVLCLQEAPRLLLWRHWRRRLARETGLVPAVSRRPGGLAVLVRPGVAVLEARHRRLSRRPGLHLRAVSVAVLDIGGRRLAVGCTHLDLEERARLEHAREALDHLDRAALRYDAPAVLAGDVNCGPDGEAWRYLTRGLADAAAAAPLGEAATFTSRRPRSRIDGIFTDPAIGVAGAGVPVDLVRAEDMAAASDHRPLLALLRL